MVKDGTFSSETEMKDFLRILRNRAKMLWGINLEDWDEYKNAKDICADCFTRSKGISEKKKTWICPNCKAKHDTATNTARVIYFAYRANNQK